MTSIKFETIGLVELEIPNKSRQTTKLEVDLFDLYNRMREANEQSGNHGLATILKEAGFGEVSHATAVKVINRLSEEVAEVKKKDL